MNWKTKQKLLKAKKLYLVESDKDMAIEIKIQLDSEYVSFKLNSIFLKVKYLNLSPNGFKYDLEKDIKITHYYKNDILLKLKNSKGYKNNNSTTIDSLIVLIKGMSDYI
jgi:hypothetical protein